MLHRPHQLRNPQGVPRISLLRHRHAPRAIADPRLLKSLSHRQRDECVSTVALEWLAGDETLDGEDNIQDAKGKNGPTAWFLEEPGLPVVPIWSRGEGAEFVASSEAARGSEMCLFMVRDKLFFFFFSGRGLSINEVYTQRVEYLYVENAVGLGVPIYLTRRPRKANTSLCS